MTFTALFVVELEGTVQLQVVVGVAKAAIAVGVPQQTIALVGEDKRYRDLRVILEQILVLALHVELLALVLSQTVESLIIRRIELHLPGETMFLLLRYGVARLHTKLTLRHGKIPELLTVGGFLQQLVAIGIKEGNLACSLRHHTIR